VAGEQYALPITDIQEIIRYCAPRALGAGGSSGVISLRGRIVPVGDLPYELGAQAERNEEAKIMILETPTGSAGIVVDEVEEVISVESDQIDRSAVATGELMLGIARVNERLVVLLDPRALTGRLALAA